MSEETRRVLKAFGISVTNLEQVADEMAKALSGKGLSEMGEEELSNLLNRYREANRSMNERLIETLELIARIHDKAISALTRT